MSLLINHWLDHLYGPIMELTDVNVTNVIGIYRKTISLPFLHFFLHHLYHEQIFLSMVALLFNVGFNTTYLQL